MSTSDRMMREEIAAGERWLATFDTPEPSEAGIERLRRAVRAELGRGAVGTERSRCTPWHGALAAAASIAVAVTVGWQSARQHDAAARLTAEAELGPIWSVETRQDAVALMDMENALTELEAWSSEERWSLGGTALYEALEGAIEELPESSEEESGESVGRTPQMADPEVV